MALSPCGRGSPEGPGEGNSGHSLYDSNFGNAALSEPLRESVNYRSLARSFVLSSGACSISLPSRRALLHERQKPFGCFGRLSLLGVHLDEPVECCLVQTAPSRLDRKRLG